MNTYAETISLSGRRKKKLEKQIEKCLNALKGNRHDPKLHIELGDTYAELEAAPNSIKHYYAAIELLRQTPAAGKLKNSIPELYEKVIALAPQEPKAYLDLSEEYLASGQKEKAFRFLLTSAKKAYETEHYALALQCYHRVIAKGRTNPHIVERCTELYLKLGRKDDALKNYVAIGDGYAQEEKHIEALDYYRKACALDQENPQLILKIARMYNAMAWTENAASELVRVGELYEKQQDYAEALRYYRYSVRLDPENEKAQEGRRRIAETHPAADLSAAGGEEPDTADVLEELEKIETAGNTQVPAETQSSPAKSEMTPFDPNATRTYEDAKDSGRDAVRVTEPEFSLTDLDQETLFSLLDEKDASPMMDSAKFLSPAAQAPESPDRDQADLALLLSAEDAESLPEGSTTQAAAAANDISLADWIIDLREEALIELALEEAFEDQGPAADVAGDGTESAAQPAAALPGQGDEDWMNVAYESAAIPVESEVAERLDLYLAEERGAPEIAEPFLQIDLEQAANESFRMKPAQPARPAEPKERGTQKTFEPLRPVDEGDSDQTASSFFDEADIFAEQPQPDAEQESVFALDADAIEEELNQIQVTVEQADAIPEAAAARDEPEQMPPALFEEPAANVVQPESPQLEAEPIEAATEQAVAWPEEATGTTNSGAAQPAQTPAETEEIVDFLNDAADLTTELVQAQAAEQADAAAESSPFNQAHGRENLIQLRQHIEDLEQRLQRTEEEKYFLQERFTAQISHHKAHEESLQKEIAAIYKDRAETRITGKQEYEIQTQQAAAAPGARRKGAAKFDDARYEALIAKIQSKKTLLQQHLNKLLHKRQENGRLLTEELNNLNATKQRLQSNVAYIQQVKGRLEEKIQTELLQAKQEAQALSQRSQELEDKLRAQQQTEQHLRKQLTALGKEKGLLQDNYAKSVTAFTKEKTALEKQIEQASQAKKAMERILRTKLQNLHQAYQQVKTEYNTALTAKEAQITESAHQLSEFTDKYVNLENTLSDIRKERDTFNTLFVEETATREMLEDKLINIETQVDSLEVQGAKLLTELGQELDRHFDHEQAASDKLQLSLDELEGLLVLQEKEIHSLEAL